MALNYTLIFVNNSTNAGDACIYQKDPDIEIPNVLPLAWLTIGTYPGVKVTFSWTIEYGFVWAESGSLATGVVFSASQYIPADLALSNQISLDYGDEGFRFTNQGAGLKADTLYIIETKNIPPNKAAVGIGMAGSGTFAVQAQPNLNPTFTPHPEYWIAFGNYTQGQVLGTGSVSNSVQIVFPLNIYSMTAILQPDNTWTVQPTVAVNAAYLKAREHNSSARWGVL